MLGTGHHFTGALMGVAIAGLAYRFGAHIAMYEVGMVALAGWYGGVAPDRLEMRKSWKDKKGWHSTTTIPHRTYTHVLLFWLLASIAGGLALLIGHPVNMDPIYWVVFGFFMGGLTHIIVDWPNPMGVPLVDPHKRHSLRLWRSGEYEIPIILVFGLFAWMCWGMPV
ncbi:metal-dependent hydrolase [Acidithiobacillus sp. M4-SHS-6]|uniref:metal-dependent hydrolase n=1 Tax=Acidithiobacillus sp. M4-SHS-6 TaxID=3383024 RepID=UPI0039BE3067